MEHYWLAEPLASPNVGTSENDYTVIPDRLCSICHKAVKLFANNSFFDHLTSSGTIQPHDYKSPCDVPLRHHATYESLDESAQNGCHLCALLAAVIFGDDCQRLRQRHIDGLSLFIKRDGLSGKTLSCQKMMMRLCEQKQKGKFKTVHIYCVLLHRHIFDRVCPNDAEHNRRFEDPTDFKLRWYSTTRSPVGLEAALIQQ